MFDRSMSLANILFDVDDLIATVSLGVCWILRCRATVSYEVSLCVYVPSPVNGATL